MKGFSVLLVLALLAGGSPARGDDLAGKPVTEIRIEGLKHTKEHIVRRELASRVGAPYSPDTLQTDRERLDRLRIFSAIDVRPVAHEGGVMIAIAVIETFPYLPTLSLQLSDENGLSGGPGIRSTNFLGQGIELGASAQFGGSTNVNLFVRDPWVAGNHFSYEAEYLRRERLNELDGFEEIAHEPRVRLGSFIGRDGRIGALASLTVIESDRDGVTLSPDNRDRMTTFGGYLGYDTRDLWTSPRNGWWNELEISHTNVADVGSSFTTYTFDLRRYQTWASRHTLQLTSLTTLQSGTVGVDIPLHADFHIGGTNTVRGYGLDARSGKNQQIHSAEYRYTLFKPGAFRVSFFTGYLGIQLAAFADAGHAWSKPRDFAMDQFIGGYGAGIRVLVPFVDEIRIDVGFGEPGKGATFHLGIYPKAVMQRVRVR